ncbi:MAG: LysR substrate-binding domain-containing protein, partial [Rhodospirillales bacterium]|nr:LysR substrate-binding domain-containing protein [Rhodospirillales bacterium]
PKQIIDMNNYNCVVTTNQLNEGSWTFRNKDDDKPIDVSMGVIVNNIGIARELVIDGLGLGMLPNFLCRHDIKTKRLVRVLEDWECHSLEVSATFIGRRRIPKKTRAFLEFISEQLVVDD